MSKLEITEKLAKRAESILRAERPTKVLIAYGGTDSYCDEDLDGCILYFSGWDIEMVFRGDEPRTAATVFMMCRTEIPIGLSIFEGTITESGEGEDEEFIAGTCVAKGKFRYELKSDPLGEFYALIEKLAGEPLN